MDMYYKNFEELQEHNLEIAASLLEEVGEGEWQNNGIEFFHDLEEDNEWAWGFDYIKIYQSDIKL